MSSEPHGQFSIAERFHKLEAKIAEHGKHIEALECTDVFSRQVLKRIEALEAWRGGQPVATPGDPFGEYMEYGADEDLCYDCASVERDLNDEPCKSCNHVGGTKNNWTPKPSQPKPHICDTCGDDRNECDGYRNNTAVCWKPKPSQPELVEGFWYILSSGSFVKVSQYKDGLSIDALSKSDGGGYAIRPATLDDLAHEVDGVKVWMVEREDCIVQMMYNDAPGYYGIVSWGKSEYPIARHIAAKCGWPIITEAQWRELIK